MMNKSKFIKRLLGLLHGNEQKADELPSSHAIANTNVVGSQGQTMYDYVMSNHKDVCIMNDVLFENYYRRRLQYDNDFLKFWKSQGLPIEQYNYNCHLAGIGVFKLKGES